MYSVNGSYVGKISPFSGKTVPKGCSDVFGGGIQAGELTCYNCGLFDHVVRNCPTEMKGIYLIRGRGELPTGSQSVGSPIESNSTPVQYGSSGTLSSGSGTLDSITEEEEFEEEI